MKQPICIAILSDLHINFPWSQARRVKELRSALDNLAKMKELDALCVLGDLSDHGLSIQVKKACHLIHRFEQQQDIPCFVSLGNHDLRHVLPFLSSPRRLMNKTRQYLHHDVANSPYEANMLYHVPILSLSSERNDKNTAYFSDDQLSWLSSMLDEYKQRPWTILLNHQPLSNSHPHSEEYGLGEQDKQVKDILAMHHHPIWISGHLHNDARTVSYLQNPVGIQLDIPSFQLPLEKEAPIGCGCILEIYEDYIHVKVINLLHNTLLHSYTIETCQ